MACHSFLLEGYISVCLIMRTAELPNRLNCRRIWFQSSSLGTEGGLKGYYYGLCKMLLESYLPIVPGKHYVRIYLFFYMVILVSMSGFYLTPPVTQLQKWAEVPPEHRANGETFDLPQASINDHGDGRMSYCLWLRYWMVIYEYSRGSPIRVGYVKVCIMYYMMFF